MDLLALAARVAAAQHDCTKCHRPIPPGTEVEAFGVLYHKNCAPKGAKRSSDDIPRTSIVKKTPGKDEWCVKSEKHSDWSGGCFPSKEKAEDRLKQVEFFKHKKSSVDLVLSNCGLVLASDRPDAALLDSFRALLSSFNDEAEAVELDHVALEKDEDGGGEEPSEK